MIAEAQAHADLMQCLFRAADAFAAGAPQHDDMTLVVLRISV
jgi:serine phosphatase RsbU (regulator of sigma subunit)